MLTYIKHHIRKITEEDRWNDLIENTFLLVFFGGLTAWIWLSHLNYIPEEGPKYPPPCQGKGMGNRLLVNHKTCCSLFNCNNCECMTYDEFWEVFDSCKQSHIPTAYSMPYFVADNYLFTGTQIMRVE